MTILTRCLIDYSPTKERVHRNGGKVYSVSPYALLWNNDTYYLVGFHEHRQQIAKFRVDRIDGLRITQNASLQKPEDFDVSAYFTQEFSMLTGKTCHVTLLCENALMNSIIDRFGEDVSTQVVDESHFSVEVMRAKLRAGMHINLRASSLIDNLSFLVDGCKDQPWRDFVSICTDDVHAKDLLTVGHINNVVRKAVASGLDGREVVKMATFNAAREYGFDDLGAIAPGYIADIQLVDALDGSRPKAVFTEGVLVAEDGKYLGGDCKTADYDLPNTVDLPQITGPASFELRVPEGYTGDTIRVNVMVSEDGNRILRHVEPVELPVRDGVVDISGDPTLVFVCCANRYGLGGKTIAVYRDFGLRSGALASTISHDSHNFTVSYHDPKDAFRAAEILRACGGGVCVIDGEQETHIALPAAGLMSQKPCAEVADEIAAVQSALDVISDGQLTLLATAVMALPVLPSVVITDMGLVNGANQTFVPVFADAEA